MAEVIPFRGILYNPQKVDATSVMAPPYDIVTPEFRETLYDQSLYNIIRIDFGKDMKGNNEKENRYTRASRFFKEWLKKGILINDIKPSFYCYEVNYNPPLPPFNSPLTKGGHKGVKGGWGGINTHAKKLRGFIGAVKLEELGKGRIHPHEMTYSKPKTDRLNIIRFCNANISPIFSFYSSKERFTSSILKKIVKNKAFIEAIDSDGFVHRLWKINDKTSIEAIKKELSDKHIFIADGHHRYETALEFKNEMNRFNRARGKGQGAKPWDYVMMFLVNIEDDGLTLLPTHRLIKYSSKVQDSSIAQKLKPYFEITSVKYDLSLNNTIGHMFKMMKNRRHLLGMYMKNKKAFYVLKFKGLYLLIDSHQSLKRLDVTILHKFIFEKLLGANKIGYEMNPEVAIEKVNKGMHQAVFFLSPTRIEDVKKVALAGQRMPPKSTYFYPKLLTGMVIYKF